MILFDDVMNPSKVIFHMEARNNYVVTYPSTSNPVEVRDVYVDYVPFFNKQAFRGAKDADKGYITITDNLFKNAKDKKLTITMWLLISDLNDTSILFPYSGTRYDPLYDRYVYAKCRPIGELRVENDLTVFHTEHYTSGSYYFGKIKNNHWTFVTITIDGTVNSNNKVRLYIDGKLISPGYTTNDSNPLGFDMDWWDLTKVGMQHRWEFPGSSVAGTYFLQEFTVYNDCLVYDESFEIPTVPSNNKLLLPLTNRTYLRSIQIGSKDPTPLINDQGDDGIQYLQAYDKTELAQTPITYPNHPVQKVAFLGDSWTVNNSGYWTNLVAASLPASYNYATENATSTQIASQFNTAIAAHPDIDLFLVNIGEADLASSIKIDATMDVVKGIVSYCIENRRALLLLSYTRMSTRTSQKSFDVLAHDIELDTALRNYFYGADTEIDYPLVYYYDMYIEEDLIYDFHPELYQNDGIHLNTDGHAVYARYVLAKAQELMDAFNTYQYPKNTYYDFVCRLLVAKYDIFKELNPCTVIVDNRTWDLILDIPWPYTQFKEDEQFFVVAPNGQFVPEYDYTRINIDQIKLKNDPYNSGYGKEWKFVFLHKHLFYAVRKYEQSIVTSVGTRKYKINSPFDKVVDLTRRVRVYFDRNFLAPDSGLYSWNNDTQEIELSADLDFFGSHLLSFLAFYTGTDGHNDDTRANLPMSGYIEFSKKHIDRVYDKDLYAVFVNGKLVHRKHLLDFSSGIHKIKDDIKSRNDLQVLNMSPQVSFLAPFIKKQHERRIDKTVTHEFFGKLRIPYPGVYHPRHYVCPDWLTPVEWKPVVADDHLNWYLNLVHHGVQEAEKTKGLQYTLKFFRDPWTNTPEAVKVVAQIRLKGNTEQWYPDHPTQTLIGYLPSTLTQNTGITANIDAPKNKIIDGKTFYPNGMAPEYPDGAVYPRWNCLFSIQLQTIVSNDSTFSKAKYGKSVDGIMARLELNSQHTDNWSRLWYELEANNYERDTEIEILEWTISDKPNNTGNIWYRKMLRFFPFDVPNFPEEDGDTYNPNTGKYEDKSS